jgi:hypothetical protein
LVMRKENQSFFLPGSMSRRLSGSADFRLSRRRW